MPETPQIKGFAIRGVLKYIKQSDYDGGIPALLDSLADDDRILFQDRILTSNWYPYRTFCALLEAIDRELPADGPEHSRMFEVGEFSGRQDAGTIFKIVLTLSSIERVIGACPRFWKRYCTAGSFETPEVLNGRVRVTLNDFPDIDPRHCELAAGWMQGLGARAGARGAQMRQVRCVHRGDPACEYEGSWSQPGG